ncbi:MAG: ABC transporter ATP-binding protein [Thermoleophilia bacterium]
MIELKNITKAYMSGGVKINAVDNVSLKVADGEFIAVVGHSGSGKTTMVSLMGGLTKPTTGNVMVGGTDIWTLDNKQLALLRSEKIGFCFQFSSLIPTLTCLDNVRLPASFAGGQRGGVEHALSLLETVGVPDKANAYPSELSGGQQRRVAIARALINEPGIILADEPTGDLDEYTEADIMELFEQVNARGVTIVMVTHSRNLAARAVRTLVMENGTLSESSKTSS